MSWQEFVELCKLKDELQWAVKVGVWDVMDKYGMREEGTYHSGFASLLAAARDGSAAEQFVLGWMHEFSVGLGKGKLIEAARWYRLASNQNHPLALCSLGNFFFSGNGVKKDREESVRLFKLGAEAEGENTLAILNLGCIYEKGEPGVLEKDRAMANSYFLLAAERGSPDALHLMGWRYHDGIEVEQNAVKAIEYYEAAITKSNHSNALYNLGRLYRDGILFQVKPDLEKARYYFQRAVDQKDSTMAMLALAKMIENGNGGPDAKPSQVVELVMGAAEKDHTGMANERLGFIFLKGTSYGVSRDRKKAATFFWLASMKEEYFETSAFTLAGMYHKPQEVNDLPFDAAKAMQFYKLADKGGTRSFELQLQLKKKLC